MVYNNDRKISTNIGKMRNKRRTLTYPDYRKVNTPDPCTRKKEEGVTPKA